MIVPPTATPELHEESAAESARAEAARPAGAAGPAHVTLIEPPRRWQLINVAELWRFRELLYYLTWRDVKVRYKQTVLGAAWAVLQPAMMMVVFSIFFGRLAGVSSGDLPYRIFVYAGLLPWTFFSTAISNAGNSVVGSERLVTKIYFPRLNIPFAAVAAAVVDFVIAFAMLLVLMAWYGVYPGKAILLVPVLLGLLTLAALGVGSLLAALNVAYRDFRYVIPFLVQIWMFATPSIYMQPLDVEPGPAANVAASAEETSSVAADANAKRDADRAAAPDAGRKAGQDSLPPVARAVLKLNPITGLVSAFRASTLGGPMPWSSIGLSATLAAAMFVGGCLYFRRVEDSFADII